MVSRRFMVVLGVMALALLLVDGDERAAAQFGGDEVYLPPSEAPLRCSQLAETETMLDNVQVVQLCSGAISDAPARCYLAAEERTFLSDSQAISLCQYAISTAPVDCYEQTNENTGLADFELVSYCATVRGLSGLPENTSSSTCLVEALDRTLLDQNAAMQLCQGATSAVPVECYLRGQAETDYLQQELIQLCAPVVLRVCAPVAPPPPSP